MKEMSCAQMGGPCDAKMKANSMDEMVGMGMEHLKQAHPEMAADVAKMSKEDTDKWSMEFKQKWDSTPDLAM